jgi:hypothetical protein
MSGSDATRPPSAGVKLTYDDLVHVPDDGKRGLVLPLTRIFSAPA